MVNRVPNRAGRFNACAFVVAHAVSTILINGSGDLLRTSSKTMWGVLDAIKPNSAPALVSFSTSITRKSARPRRSSRSIKSISFPRSMLLRIKCG